MTEPIFHLAEPADWSLAGEEYEAPSLASEGFIHCSTADQLDRTARLFYADRDDLILLEIDAQGVGDNLVYEDLVGTGEPFPHVYGPIPQTAIRSATPYKAPKPEPRP